MWPILPWITYALSGATVCHTGNWLSQMTLNQIFSGFFFSRSLVVVGLLCAFLYLNFFLCFVICAKLRSTEIESWLK